MHGFTNNVVPAETKTDIADAPGNLGSRALHLNFTRRLDEIDGIVIMLFHARRNREDIRVKNDILRRKADFFRQ